MTRKETLLQMADRLRSVGFGIAEPQHLPALICDKCSQAAVWALTCRGMVVSLYCQEHAEQHPAFPEGRQAYSWANLSQAYDQAQTDLLMLLDGRAFCDYDTLQKAIEVLPTNDPDREEMLPLDYRARTIEWGLEHGWIRPVGEGFGPVVAVPKGELVSSK